MAPAHPTIFVWIGDAGEPLPLPPPATIEPRAWALGVAAMQVAIEQGKVVARVRRHETGAEEAEVLAVTPPILVHAAALLPGTQAHLPQIELAPLAGDDPVARLSMHVDGAKVAAAALSRAELSAANDGGPTLRAFGHFFCRWLRDGTCEVGCDVTGFHPHVEGEKHPRLLVKTLSPGHVASFGLVTLP